MSPRHYRFEAGAVPVLLAPEDGFFPHEGVFTTFRVESDGTVFAWENHLNRLKAGCDFFGYRWPIEGLSVCLPKIQALVSPEMPVVRIALIPHETLADAISVIVSFRPMPEMPVALRLTQVKYNRVFPEIKHLLPGPEQWALDEIRSEGWDDYLRLNDAGNIAEACYANVFFVTHQNTLLTPDAQSSGCLPGIMGAQVLEACDLLGISVETGTYSPEILSQVKGVFLTNAVRGLMPVKQVDNQKFDPEDAAPLMARISSGLRSRNTISPLS